MKYEILRILKSATITFKEIEKKMRKLATKWYASDFSVNFQDLLKKFVVKKIEEKYGSFNPF